MHNKCIDDGDYRSAQGYFKTIVNAQMELKFKSPIQQDLPQPTVLVITADPEVLGIKALPEAELQKRIKYWKKEKEVRERKQYEDIEFKEVKDGEGN